MTDRELLELAAKASGIEIEGFYADGTAQCSNGAAFNPLTDDGDALRLAVKLGMVIDVRYGAHDRHKNTTVCVNYWIKPSTSLLISENGFDDYQSATRRAIVRAAAEIGKQLQS